MLAGLRKRFQTRIYKLGKPAHARECNPVNCPGRTRHAHRRRLEATGNRTPPTSRWAQFFCSAMAARTPPGMGGSGISVDALQALRNRRLPVHTIGFGDSEPAHDVEIEDVSVAATAAANARVAATVSLMQHGYTGQKATLTVRDRSTRHSPSAKLLLRPTATSKPSRFTSLSGLPAPRASTFAVEPLPAKKTSKTMPSRAPFWSATPNAASYI